MLRTQSWGMPIAGLVLGLTIGGAMTIGVLLGQRTDSVAQFAGFDDLRLKAMASHGGDTFAIATGPVDDEVEGLFTVDYLTGDLQCFVPNPRTGGVAGWFKANVANDLTVERGKKPAYLIATGEFNFSSASGNSRPAASLVYIVARSVPQASPTRTHIRPTPTPCAACTASPTSAASRSRSCTTCASHPQRIGSTRSSAPLASLGCQTPSPCSRGSAGKLMRFSPAPAAMSKNISSP